MARAGAILIIIWIICLAFMVITKKDKQQIKETFFVGSFFTTIWIVIYLLVL
ncbi:hypothetical protein [Mesonia maritima]|uniref:Uncharacterized protein n=1 Tax=Mesonia maritima TaxID=1793873 RepID=A0ABU1K3S4_9FLAO|nr:hypothetical protein [Mesonia maritima]MDR6300243.1 hypothetical protein [Mesonia maritima]